jgi:hypothetical protein
MASVLPIVCLTMVRAATALIVIALSGSPTAKLLCDSWCFGNAHSRSIADSACHKVTAAEQRGARLEVPPAGCDMSLGSPFVPEARHRALEHAAGTAAFFAVAVPRLDSHRKDGMVLLGGDSGPPLGHTVTPLRI